MPVVTRSQTKALAEANKTKPVTIIIKPISDLVDAIRALNANFPRKKTVQKQTLLCKFIDDTTQLLEPAIKEFSWFVTFNYLKLFVALHNRMLYMAMQLDELNDRTATFKARNYAKSIVEYMQKYTNISINRGPQGRISKCVIDNEVYDLNACLFLNE